MSLTSMKSNPVDLGNETLGIMPAHVSVPQYDRNRMTPGIVHIGVGNFHRAHFAWYIHRLMQEGLAMDWAIIGAGVREQDQAMREKLLKQDCLTTLIELDPQGGRATEIIGSMLDFLPVEQDNRSLIAMMADARIRIVSLTITEGGYYIDAASNGLDISHPDIVHDAENPERPRTAFGAMVAALRIRRDQGTGPFAGLCCDNLQGNGEILKQTIIGLARLGDPELAEWIDRNCTFPNSMVDCIVPATGPDEIDLVQTLGIGDQAPVTHENFRQWVIEDSFCTGRPDWNRVGAEFSEHVHHHETQKIRILNGGHQILANAAEIMGIKTIAEAMENPLIKAMFRKVQREEITPHITPVPNISVLDYLDLIETRFANKAIVDTVRRVAFDGAARHAGFLLPSIRDGLNAGGSIDGLALVEAIWARMCLGSREDGSLIAPNDPIWSILTERAAAARHTPLVWLEMQKVYGDLARDDRFATAFEKWLSAIYNDGIEATIASYLG
ncbi:mannitol dehydrogenase family protein [Alphaproteobacteria bacterium LSUCC0684]